MHTARFPSKQASQNERAKTTPKYTLSKKTVHFCFCQNFVKFPPTLESFGM